MTVLMWIGIWVAASLLLGLVLGAFLRALRKRDDEQHGEIEARDGETRRRMGRAS